MQDSCKNRESQVGCIEESSASILEAALGFAKHTGPIQSNERKCSVISGQMSGKFFPVLV